MGGGGGGGGGGWSNVRVAFPERVPISLFPFKYKTLILLSSNVPKKS